MPRKGEHWNDRLSDPDPLPGEVLAIAREALGLSRWEMATLLGYRGNSRGNITHDLQAGRKVIREPQRRLLYAYLTGYRPSDWPPRATVNDRLVAKAIKAVEEHASRQPELRSVA